MSVDTTCTCLRRAFQASRSVLSNASAASSSIQPECRGAGRANIIGTRKAVGKPSRAENAKASVKDIIGIARNATGAAADANTQNLTCSVIVISHRIGVENSAVVES